MEKENGLSCTYLWCISDPRLYSFYRWFFSFSRSSSKTMTAFKAVPSESEDFLSNFSNACRPFGAKILLTNQSSFLLPPPRRITPLDWPGPLSFVASTGWSARDIVNLPFFSPTTLTVGPCLPIFLNAWWLKSRGVFDIPHYSLVTVRNRILTSTRLMLIWPRHLTWSAETAFGES